MTRPRTLHRGEVSGWRARSIVAAVGLRSPRADHRADEGEIISLAASGARLVVEIGAFEGGGSAAIREAMAPGGTLYVVDPYPRGRLGFSASLVTAKRLARRQPAVATEWIRRSSADAASRWDAEIDCCVIDGIHTLDGVRADWAAWGRFVREGGVVVARNDVVTDPATLCDAAAPDARQWAPIETRGTLTAFRRASG